MPFADVEQRRAYQRAYYARKGHLRVRTPEQREKQRVAQRRYDRKRAHFPHRRLLMRLRSRASAALHAQHVPCKPQLTPLIGCSGHAFREHIESLFQRGMSWHNRSEWHIDHRKPCAAFDLSDPSQVAQCFHYTNMQPLWRVDNLRKSDAYDAATFSHVWRCGAWRARRACFLRR